MSSRSINAIGLVRVQNPYQTTCSVACDNNRLYPDKNAKRIFPGAILGASPGPNELSTFNFVDLGIASTEVGINRLHVKIISISGLEAYRVGNVITETNSLRPTITIKAHDFNVLMVYRTHHGERHKEPIVGPNMERRHGHSDEATLLIGDAIQFPSEESYIYCVVGLTYSFHQGIQTIESHAFYKCSSLERICLPSTITVIRRNAFAHCTRLREAALNERLQSIAKDASYDCTSLERFTFPSISTRLLNIINGYWRKDIILNINNTWGIERRGSEISFSTTVVGFRWDRIMQSIDKIKSFIDYYEKKEFTSLFELALWKSRIQQGDLHDRNECRIDVPGPVKDTIFSYL